MKRKVEKTNDPIHECCYEVSYKKNRYSFWKCKKIFIVDHLCQLPSIDSIIKAKYLLKVFYYISSEDKEAIVKTPTWLKPVSEAIKRIEDALEWKK